MGTNVAQMSHFLFENVIWKLICAALRKIILLHLFFLLIDPISTF